MYDRFSERLKTVASVAHGEALRFRHPEVGAEHLLLGILAEEGAAAACLSALGVDTEGLRDGIGGVVLRRSRGDLAPANLPFRSDAVAALDGSIKIADSLGRNLVDPEHLLVALLGNPEGGAARALAYLGIPLERGHQAALAALGTASGGGPKPSLPLGASSKGVIYRVPIRTPGEPEPGPPVADVAPPVASPAPAANQTTGKGPAEVFLERLQAIEGKLDRILGILVGEQHGRDVDTSGDRSGG